MSVGNINVRRGWGTHMVPLRREVLQVLETSERGRPYRALFYFFLAGFGWVLLIDPTNQLDQMGVTRLWWSGFMAGGTLLSFWGAVANKWIIELLGLPLQAASLGGFIYVLVNVIPGPMTTSRYGLIFLIAAPIVVLTHRARVLSRLMKATEKMVKRAKKESDAK